jgi:hypothetical protein
MQYKRYVRAAVASARELAPSLIPQVIVSGLHDKRFEAWMRRMGGTVHHWNLSFYKELHSAVHNHSWHDEGFLNQHGAYLRLDIPFIIRQNIVGKVSCLVLMWNWLNILNVNCSTLLVSIPQFDPSEVDIDYILYTDCDVLFYKAINTCTVPPKPPVMYVGGEARRDTIENTGNRVKDVHFRNSSIP